MNFDILDFFDKDEMKFLFETYNYEKFNECTDTKKEETELEKEDRELEELMLSMHRHRREEKEKKLNDPVTSRSKNIFDSLLDDKISKSTIFIQYPNELFE